MTSSAAGRVKNSNGKSKAPAHGKRLSKPPKDVRADHTTNQCPTAQRPTAQYLLIDAIPGTHAAFHFRTWEGLPDVGYSHGVSHLVAFCRRIDLPLLSIWWHHTVSNYIVYPSGLLLTIFSYQSPVYLLETRSTDLSKVCGIFILADMMDDMVDISMCAPSVRLLPVTFQTESRVKDEG